MGSIHGKNVLIKKLPVGYKLCFKKHEFIYLFSFIFFQRLHLLAVVIVIAPVARENCMGTICRRSDYVKKKHVFNFFCTFFQRLHLLEQLISVS